MKKLRVIILMLSMLALACETPQAAEVPVTSAPTDAPKEEIIMITEAESAPTPSELPTLPPTPEPTSVPTATPEPTPEPTPPPLEGVRIGIDPGHQLRPNYDPEPNAPDSEETKAKCSSGTRGIATGVYEYEVNLSVSLKLKALLEEAGAEVFLTRTTNNVNLSNRERAEFFNSMEVDLAIRIHCNGTDDTKIRGAFMLLPSRERTSFYNENVRAATAIIEQYCQETGLSPRKNNGITYSSSQTGFNWCTRPIVCIEMGHLSNETEDLLLTNDSFQDKMAVGIYRGILAYFDPDQASEGGNP
jgi:N-acetylmuramoyl-L-alanine amidase